VNFLHNASILLDLLFMLVYFNSKLSQLLISLVALRLYLIDVLHFALGATATLEQSNIKSIDLLKVLLKVFVLKD